METTELEKRFTYHAPKGDQAERYQSLRFQTKLLAGLFESMCPESREKSLAFTKLEEAIMWANSAIARRE